MTTKKQHATTNLHQQLDVNFALQAAKLGVWELNTQTGLINWDGQCQALFGITDDSYTPYEQAIQAIHPDDVLRVDAAVQKALDHQSDGTYDETYRTIGVTDGKLRWVRFQGQAKFTDSGQLLRFGGIAQDVTQQVLDQQQLIDSEAHFRNIVEHALSPICLLKGEAMVLELGNQPLFDVWNVSADAVGKPLLDILPEMREQPIMGWLLDVYHQGITHQLNEVPTYFIRKTGEREDRYFNFIYRPWREVDGTITGVMAMATDITEQVQARQAIQSSEARFRMLIEEAPLATSLFVGRELRVAVANPPMLAIWGKGPNQVGKKLAEILPEIANQPFLGILDEVYTSGQTFSAKGGRADLVIDGVLGIYYFDFIYKPLLDANGRVYAILQMASDVTEQVLAQQRLDQARQQMQAQLEEMVAQRTSELQLANHDLTRSNDNLQQFAYIASHDLQEPLRKIQSFSSLLSQQLDDQLAPQGRDYLQRIESAGARMSTLIKDLLAYSRISTRQQAFGPVSLDAIVTGVLSTLDWQIQQTGTRINADELPVVNGDETQLGQLFQNLLTNAMKFVTPGQPPRVQIQYRQRPLSELPPQVRPTAQVSSYHQISVSDNGIGFDTKYLDRIFQVFQRLHGKKEYAGTGVGLAICQRVVENHGGAITADSQPGQGATFCVYLPA